MRTPPHPSGVQAKDGGFSAGGESGDDLCAGRLLRSRGCFFASLEVLRELAMTTDQSAHAAGDVGFGEVLLGAGEDAVGGAELDQLAEPEEAGKVGDAGGLLHVVGDDHDGV